MSTQVVYLELRGGEDRREASITICELQPYAYASGPKIYDLPPDMREALLRWLTEGIE